MATTNRRATEVVVPIEDEGDLLTIMPLGAGREVGRSCIVLQYKGKTVMLDCGLHAGHSGQKSLPYFDNIDPSTVDVLLVSHFHIDHAAAVPYYLEKTTFKGRTFMTRPTKGVFRWLANDYIRVTNTSNSESTALYTEADLISAHAKIEEIDVHQLTEVNGIKFTAFHAGHVLGAAMFLIEIAGVKVLYTGDYSREEDRHLVAAENPGVPVNVLITESTYGLQSHQPRVDREKAFMKQVRDIIRRRGSCLMPVTALGRTQELLLILEEHWGRFTAELEGVPIFFISSLGKRGMDLYKEYIMHMNQRIQRQYNRNGTNPFNFKYIKTRTNLSEVPDSGPCVVLASPGMLQNGVSRQLLERWAPRPENGLIITGYSVEGTLARSIVNGPDSIQALAGGNIPRRMSVSNISFSAHVDYAQNSAFIDEIRAPYVVLVHGEENTMRSLRANIIDKYKNSDYDIQVHAPRNTENVRLYFRGEKMARVIGSLASRVPREGDWTAGILVEKDFNYTLVDASDLQEFTSIAPVVVEQQLLVPYASSLGLLRHHLEQMFGTLQLTIEKTSSGETHILRVYDSIDVAHSSWKKHVEIEWQGGAMDDMVADSVVAVVLNIESSPASVKMTQGACGHSHSGEKHGECSIKEEDEDEDRDEEEDRATAECKGAHMLPASAGAGDTMASDALATRAGGSAEVATKLAAFLRQQFGEAELSKDRKSLVVHLGDASATINTRSLDVETENPVLRLRIDRILSRVSRTLRPLDHRSEALPEPDPELPAQVEELDIDEDVKMRADDGDDDDDRIDVDSDDLMSDEEPLEIPAAAQTAADAKLVQDTSSRSQAEASDNEMDEDTEQPAAVKEERTA
ncbi:endoribonuclease ysh1 [Kickxella alabastrina]|nr:endoribonuclease ysh1 [Kickxella alabastrina]